MSFRDFIKSILAVRKNSTGSEYRRRRMNFIEGSGVTLTVADDPTDDEVDVTIAAGASSSGQVWPYSGGDGVCDFDGSATVLSLVPVGGVYTLTRDIYLATGSSVSGTIKANGWGVFCAGTLALSGTIHADGAGGAGAAAGAGGGGGGGGGALSSRFSGGRAGGAGVATGGAGSNGSPGQNVAVQNVGGRGGTGGAAGANTGGLAGAVTAISVTNGGALGVCYNLYNAQAGMAHRGNSASDNQSFEGGSGGGSGAALATSTSGAGGGGGGICFVAAKTITGSGTISANGGNGAAGVAGNAGGGGGGGGGAVFVAGTATSITMTATKGTGGAGSGTGSSGVNGSDGIVVNFT